MANIIDSYSESNQDATSSMSAGIATRMVGQAFLGNGSAVGSAVFYLNKSGSPTGNAVARVYASSGTPPNAVGTGSPLATSDTLDVSTLTTSLALTTFNFTGANQITLTNGTYYIVVVDGGSVGDASNFIQAGYDSTSPSHGGNQAEKASISWTSYTSRDLCFYVYDNGGATPSESSFTLNNYNATHGGDGWMGGERLP